MRRRVRVHARVFIRLWRSGQTLPPLADELGLQHADAAAVHLGEAARAPELRLSQKTWSEAGLFNATDGLEC
eukprot:584274-Pleurochrysis_carterae.AAC.4